MFFLILNLSVESAVESLEVKEEPEDNTVKSEQERGSKKEDTNTNLENSPEISRDQFRKLKKDVINRKASVFYVDTQKEIKITKVSSTPESHGSKRESFSAKTDPLSTKVSRLTIKTQG